MTNSNALDGFGLRVLNLNPLVLIADGFASDQECDAVIASATGLLVRAEVIDRNFVRRFSEERSNRLAVIDHRKDDILMGLCQKLSIILGLPTTHAEPMKVLNYQPGEQFKRHRDGHDPFAEGADAEIPRGGQRIFTSMIYLNDVLAGGETRFPELEIDVAPKRGRLLVFANTRTGSGVPSLRSTHAGLPVVEGEKWAVTFWWRENPHDFSSVEG